MWYSSKRQQSTRLDNHDGHVLVQLGALVHRRLALDVVWSEPYEKLGDQRNVSKKLP